DLDVFFGRELAEQLSFQRGVVGQQDVKFGFRQDRHRSNLEQQRSVVKHTQRRRRYNAKPSAPANSVNFCRIDAPPPGESSSGAIIASAFLASSSRIIAFTGPSAVADTDSER